MSDAILFLDGKIDLSFCEKYICSHNLELPIFCADGAYSSIKDSKKLNKFIKKVIGDFDSYTFIDHNLFLVSNDQYSTDFEKCLNYILRNNFTKVYVFGASEGEMDHFLGNISIAKKYHLRLTIEFIDIYSRYFFIPKKFIVSGVEGKMFSIIPFCSSNNLYSDGLKYILKDASLLLGSEVGTRNYAVENTVRISYSTGDILLFISHGKYKGRLD